MPTRAAWVAGHVATSRLRAVTVAAIPRFCLLPSFFNSLAICFGVAQNPRNREGTQNLTAAISMAWGAMVEEEEQGKGAAPAHRDVRSPSMPLVHSQVRRIREEDLRIGAIAGEGLSERVMRFHLTLHHSSVSTDAALFFRAAALPASPLRNSRTALGSA